MYNKIENSRSTKNEHFVLETKLKKGSRFSLVYTILLNKENSRSDKSRQT